MECTVVLFLKAPPVNVAAVADNRMLKCPRDAGTDISSPPNFESANEAASSGLLRNKNSDAWKHLHSPLHSPQVRRNNQSDSFS